MVFFLAIDEGCIQLTDYAVQVQYQDHKMDLEICDIILSKKSIENIECFILVVFNNESL